MITDHPIKYCLTAFIAGSVLAACNNPDRMNETAATDTESDYELLSMKRERNVYNASASQSAVISHRRNHDEERLTGETQASGNEQTQMTDQPAGNNRNQLAEVNELPVTQTILFEFDSAQLTPQAENALDRLAESAAQVEADSVEVHLAGHADAMGPKEYNQQLSRERAQSVKDYLSDELTVAVNWDIDAHGESQPTASNNTAEGRQENRRVQLQIVPAHDERTAIGY